MRTTGSAMVTLAVATLALLTSGCATMQSTDWTGHDISEVIMKLGTPTQVDRAPQGTTYMWMETRTTVRSNTGTDLPHDGFDTSPYCLIWQFSADGKGLIRHYRVDQMPGVCGSTPMSSPNGHGNPPKS